MFVAESKDLFVLREGGVKLKCLFLKSSKISRIDKKILVVDNCWILYCINFFRNYVNHDDD